MAARAVLAPGSQQIVAGGIGSGKTTELLLAQKWLHEQPNTLALYIDVGAETDLTTLNTGAVLASIGTHLLKHVEEQGVLSPAIASIQQRINAFAFGQTDRVWVPDYYAPPPDHDDDYFDQEPGHYVTRTTPGKLKPQFPPMRREIERFRETLSETVGAARGLGKTLVMLLDGLDRLMAAEKFWDVVHQDFRLLRGLQVSLLAAAPLAILYGKGRPIADYFDHVHHLAVHDPAVSRFPMQVAKKRGAAQLIGPKELRSLCLASGGVLRDLVSLVHNGATEAYLDGSDRIRRPYASAAIRKLGESYLLGLGQFDVSLLTRLQAGGSFSTDDARHMALLVTRRVLEYQEPHPRYEVHPALSPFLEGESRRSRTRE
jgi:hypothetical protein